MTIGRANGWLCGAICLILASCTVSADTFPLNDAAKRAGLIQVALVRRGLANGPVTITMADGEVLKGTYRIAFGGGTAIGLSGDQVTTSTIITAGPVQFVAAGPKTKMLCRGTMSPSWHGSGQCQNYDGAVWAVSW